MLERSVLRVRPLFIVLSFKFMRLQAHKSLGVKGLQPCSVAVAPPPKRIITDDNTPACLSLLRKSESLFSYP